MADHDAQMTNDRRRDLSESGLAPKADLSGAERNSLAKRIALIDGVSLFQARRQMNEFLAIDVNESMAPPHHASLRLVVVSDAG